MRRGHRNTKILLVSDSEDDAGSIRTLLEESINFPCYIRHCPTLLEALDYLDAGILSADIVILDLGLFDSDNPREIYRKVDRAAANIPIIVLTGEEKEDHNLAIYAMEEGASDNMIRGRFGRITDAVKFSLIRHRIVARNNDKKTHEKNQYISWMTGGYSVEENL